MPKIKFSTLVSGVSGKSNGSVFGTNNAGSYFRTNGSKIKPNTSANSRRKSLFSEVASSWRNLTEEQQTAWNNSVTNFIVQNSFGDNRTPSGYEVYSRINNALLERGSSLMLMPPTPRAMPSISNLDTLSPDLFLYMPTVGLLNYDKSNYGTFSEWRCTSLLSMVQIMNDSFFMFQFGLPKSEQNKQSIISSFGLLTFKGVADEDCIVSLEDYTGGLWKIKLSVSGGAGIWESTTVAPVVDIAQLNTIGVFLSDTSADKIEIYLNGSFLECTPFTSGTFVNPSFDQVIQILPQSSAVGIGSYFTDFRFYVNELTQEEKENITRGYLLGTEDGAFQLSSVDINKEVVNYFDSFDGLISQILVGDVQNFKFNISNTRVPFIVLESLSVGSAGMAVQIYSTGCLSYGKTGKISNFKLIKEVGFESGASFFVSDYWRNIFKLYSPNGNMYFFLKIIDTTTGVINSTQIKPKKPKRFKAGAELSAGVN